MLIKQKNKIIKNSQWTEKKTKRKKGIKILNKKKTSRKMVDLNQWCPSKCLIGSWGVREVLLIAFVYFCVVNTPTMANLNLLAWCHWKQRWEEICIIRSCKLVQAGRHQFQLTTNLNPAISITTLSGKDIKSPIKRQRLLYC